MQSMAPGQSPVTGGGLGCLWTSSLLAVLIGVILLVFVSPSCDALWSLNLTFHTCEEGFYYLEISPSRLPPRSGLIPNSLVFLLSFTLLSYLCFQENGCLSGRYHRWLISAGIQKLFCGNCSAFKWTFDEFVGEKIGLPVYSSTILRLHYSPSIY